jgi:4-hydroxybenzoate polyprenyltransferase
MKNAVVFAALILTGQLGDPDKTSVTVAAFVLFCAVSSSVYLINDLADIEQDRMHPKKRNRPLAAGELSPTVAAIVAAALAAFGVVGGFWLSLAMGGVVLAYLALQLAYTFALKHFVIVDVLTIAGGFVLRVLAGGVAIGRPISPYLYLSVIFLALFQGFAKRRNEMLVLSDEAGSHRQSLSEYTTGILDQFMVIAAASTVVTYALYAITTPARPAGISANVLLLTIPFILYAVFRYLFLVQVHDEGGTPEEMLLSDLPLLLSVLGWGVFLLIILYALPQGPG